MRDNLENSGWAEATILNECVIFSSDDDSL